MTFEPGTIKTVAALLIGEPNAQLSKENELRYGTNGSLSIDPEKNTFYDHEANEGGGILDLICRHDGIQTRAQAVDWLKEHGMAPPDEKPAKARLVASYDYKDETGKLLFQVQRFEPKKFVQRRPAGDGWEYKVQGTRQVPYRLPELVAAPLGSAIYIVEGEKDADRLAALGLVATCNAGGAGKWRDSHSEHLKGCTVILIPDNDDAGREHVQKVAKSLEGIAAHVRIMELAGLPEKGDVSDWLDAGGTAEELARRASNPKKDKTEEKAWPALDALAEGGPPTPNAFPFHALGPILGSAARAIAEDVQAPDSLAGGSVLAAASLAVQPLANVVLPHGLRAPLSVFVVTGAGSGDRKSAVDAVACKEVEDVRKQQARDYSRAMQAYESDLAAKKKGDDEPEKPAPKSLTTSNATIEGICRLLKFQSHLGIFSAEGGEMLGGHSLRDDKRSSGLAFYLKGWSGESLDSLRGGDGLTVLLGRRMALHVLVQPVLLGALLCDPLAQGQGLLARCLIAQPDTLAGHRPYRDVNPQENPDVIAYNERIRALLSSAPTLWPEGDGYELKPRDLYLDTDARALWIAFYNEIERQQANGNELEGARPFASKAAEHAARIAGIITMVENPQATHITSQAMDGAIQLTAFYLNEHLRLTGAGRQERQDGALRRLLEWLQERGTTVAKKDVLQRTPRAIRDLKAAGINALLADLVQRSYIREAGDTWEIRHV